MQHVEQKAGKELSLWMVRKKWEEEWYDKRFDNISFFYYIRIYSPFWVRPCADPSHSSGSYLCR